MKEKAEGKQISYRPPEDMKKVFEKYCSGPASISRAQLLEIAMRFLNSQGEEKMKEIMVQFLFNERGHEMKKKSA